MPFTLPRNPRFYRPRYMLEALPVYLLYGICALLPVDAASGLGGWLARTIGMRMGVSRRAEHNLQRAMPELDAAARRNIIRGMWDNLGRVFAEYPHLPHLMPRCQVTGDAALTAMVTNGKGGIVISGHLANWELGSLVALGMQTPLAVIYRAPNNPYVDALIKKARQKLSPLTLPKGTEGAIHLMRHLRNHGYAGILIDQKLNEGILVPFFGIDARTASAPAEMAIRFDCPIVIARVVRVRGAHFQVEIIPVVIPNTGNRTADTAALTGAMTAQLELWIREHPEQWLWLHNRWPKA